MSRTIRKHAKPFKLYYGWQRNNYCINFIYHDEDFYKRENIRYHTDSGVKYGNGGIPKKYRKMVNRNRRNFDKIELYKAVNFIDYPEQCSKWNGKDNDHWIYY